MKYGLYGRFDKAGHLVQDTQVCAVSGEPIVPGDLTVHIKDTGCFYRVKAGKTVPEDRHNELVRLVQQGEPPEPNVAPTGPLKGKGQG